MNQSRRSTSNLPCDRWGIRVLGGSSNAVQFALSLGRHIVGSDATCSIRVPSNAVAPRLLELTVSPTTVVAQPLGRGITWNGAQMTHAVQAKGGDVIEFAGVQFQLIDHSVSPTIIKLTSFLKSVPLWLQLAVSLGGLAILLIVLMVSLGNPKLVPITTIVASSVVPIVALSFLLSAAAAQAPTLRSVLMVVLLGATLGVVATLGLRIVLPLGTGAVFAPIYEEPAKLLATFVCWHRTAYRNPMSGLIIGFAAGTGFEIAENAGYFLESASEQGLGVGLVVLALRSVLAPVSHGMWTAICASAWFQCGWGFHGSWRPIFLRALVASLFLHGLWNSGIGGFIAPITSACLTAWLFFRLWRTKGTWTARWQLAP